MWVVVGDKRMGQWATKCVGNVGRIRKGVPRSYDISSPWEADTGRRRCWAHPDAEELLSAGQHLPNVGSEF